MDKVKEMVKKGNVSKIAVKKGDETIVNIPVNVGVVGALVAPWGVIAAAIAAVGFKCTVELTTTDGKVIDITKRAEGFASDVKEKGSVVLDEGTGAYNSIKEAACDKYNEFKSKKEDLEDIFENTEDAVEEVLEGTDEEEKKEEE